MTEEVIDIGLLSVRNLTEGGAKTPLRDFAGVLASVTPGLFGKVDFNFTDVEVMESTEPYNFPTAVISIKPSNRKESGWGLWGESVKPFLSAEEDAPKNLIGLKQRWQVELDHLYSGKDPITGKQFTGDVWHVIELEGHEKAEETVPESQAPTTASSKPKASKTGPAEAEAIKLLDGKTLAEFNKAAYSSPVIRKDEAFQISITNKSFVKALIAAGRVTKDENDIYHVVT